MAVTPLNFRFYLCVQIFITIEQILKIFLFWGYGPVKSIGDVHSKIRENLTSSYVFFLIDNVYFLRFWKIIFRPLRNERLLLHFFSDFHLNNISSDCVEN